MTLKAALVRLVEIMALPAALAAPFLTSNFTLSQLTLSLCYGMGVIGLKLLSGYNGQFSLGHSVFFAVGAYTSVILTNAGMSFYLTLPCAVAIAFLLGFMVGWPALRIRGHHLAVVTLVLALASPQILRSSILAPLTGGAFGIGLPALPVPIAGLDADVWWYLVALVLALLCTTVALITVRSRLGRAMEACRDNPAAARVAGINTARVNTLSFGFSAAFGGLGGALIMGSQPYAYVGPDTFTLFLAISLLVAVIATGPRWIVGSFLGGILIVNLPNWAEGLAVGLGRSHALILVFYGLLLLVVICAQTFDFRRLRPNRRNQTATKAEANDG